MPRAIPLAGIALTVVLVAPRLIYVPATTVSATATATPAALVATGLQRDHSTVLHGHGKIAAAVGGDALMATVLDSIRKSVLRGRKDGVVTLGSVDLGKDPIAGKRRERSQTFHARREAKAALARWQAEISQGTVADKTNGTVADLMTYWLETYV